MNFLWRHEVIYFTLQTLLNERIFCRLHNYKRINIVMVIILNTFKTNFKLLNISINHFLTNNSSKFNDNEIYILSCNSPGTNDIHWGLTRSTPVKSWQHSTWVDVCCSWTYSELWTYPDIFENNSPHSKLKKSQNK